MSVEGGFRRITWTVSVLVFVGVLAFDIYTISRIVSDRSRVAAWEQRAAACAREN